MISKFNFYDIYGYFLPGLVVLTLLWLPFGVIDRALPAGELFTALPAIPFAYIVGHILQDVARSAFPSTAKGGRYPSDIILDPEDSTLLFGIQRNIDSTDKKHVRHRRDGRTTCCKKAASGCLLLVSKLAN